MKKYALYYRVNKIPYTEWNYQDTYNKTDALGTANLWLKQNYQVLIVPIDIEE